MPVVMLTEREREALENLFKRNSTHPALDTLTAEEVVELAYKLERLDTREGE